MARIRSIKPEFWTSEQILECSTNARLLFIGLWNFCDDAGRHPYSAKQVKAEVFPADTFTEKHMLAMLEELETNGLICRYCAENKEYFYVTGWQHQRIDKPHKAKYPDPFGDNSKSIPRTLPPDTIGYDRKGKDKNICAVPDGTRTLECHFEEFWKIKPGRGKAANPRAPALNAYKRAVKAGADPTTINAAAKVWASADSDAIGTKFTPTAAVWLNQRRFEDYQSRPEDAAKIVENEEFMKRRGYAWIENKWIKTEETNGQDQGTAGGIPARSETG